MIGGGTGTSVGLCVLVVLMLGLVMCVVLWCMQVMVVGVVPVVCGVLMLYM
jgi:hypothetical protein